MLPHRPFSQPAVVRAALLGLGLAVASAGCKDNKKENNSTAGAAQFSQGPYIPPVLPLPQAPLPLPAPVPLVAPISANCISQMNCPPARQDVVSTSTNGTLVGVVGQPVSWIFYGRDLSTLGSLQMAPGVQGSARRVMVLLAQLPQGAQLSPVLNGTAVYSQESILWTPQTTLSGNLLLLLRDYDRCMITEPAPAQVCNGVTQTRYDFAGSVPWKIYPSDSPTGMQAVSGAPGSAPGTFIGNVIGGVLGSLLTTYANNQQPPASSPGTYNNCQSNGGSGYGCMFSCGASWCAKDSPDLGDYATCLVTRSGGSVCQ